MAKHYSNNEYMQVHYEMDVGSIDRGSDTDDSSTIKSCARGCVTVLCQSVVVR